MGKVERHLPTLSTSTKSQKKLHELIWQCALAYRSLEGAIQVQLGMLDESVSHDIKYIHGVLPSCTD